jgi:hypothetical protein
MPGQRTPYFQAESALGTAADPDDMTMSIEKVRTRDKNGMANKSSGQTN